MTFLRTFEEIAKVFRYFFGCIARTPILDRSSYLRLDPGEIVSAVLLDAIQRVQGGVEDFVLGPERAL
ncbi:hypothetical protein [Mesorhizobium sp. CN2-181]|uniref:hypothetical protein n=1 Tax=Mesorhizobium yinganensis TaxID=3157707 RepID=UPI0032B85336